MSYTRPSSTAANLAFSSTTYTRPASTAANIAFNTIGSVTITLDASGSPQKALSVDGNATLSLTASGTPQKAISTDGNVSISLSASGTPTFAENIGGRLTLIAKSNYTPQLGWVVTLNASTGNLIITNKPMFTVTSDAKLTSSIGVLSKPQFTLTSGATLTNSTVSVNKPQYIITTDSSITGASFTSSKPQFIVNAQGGINNGIDVDAYLLLPTLSMDVSGAINNIDVAADIPLLECIAAIDDSLSIDVLAQFPLLTSDFYVVEQGQSYIYGTLPLLQLTTDWYGNNNIDVNSSLPLPTFALIGAGDYGSIYGEIPLLSMSANIMLPDSIDVSANFVVMDCSPAITDGIYATGNLPLLTSSFTIDPTYNITADLLLPVPTIYIDCGFVVTENIPVMTCSADIVSAGISVYGEVPLLTMSTIIESGIVVSTNIPSLISTGSITKASNIAINATLTGVDCAAYAYMNEYIIVSSPLLQPVMSAGDFNVINVSDELPFLSCSMHIGNESMVFI